MCTKYPLRSYTDRIVLVKAYVRKKVVEETAASKHFVLRLTDVCRRAGAVAHREWIGGT